MLYKCYINITYICLCMSVFMCICTYDLLKRVSHIHIRFYIPYDSFYLPTYLQYVSIFYHLSLPPHIRWLTTHLIWQTFDSPLAPSKFQQGESERVRGVCFYTAATPSPPHESPSHHPFLVLAAYSVSASFLSKVHIFTNVRNVRM